MEKFGQRMRDIQFFSDKNKHIICVHTKQARDYAKYLENEVWVESYEAGRLLEKERYQNMKHVGIRGSYFRTEWTSDFFIRYVDGRCGIRELILSADDLKKRAVVEKLEFSRRYWSLFDIDEWKVVLMSDDE